MIENFSRYFVNDAEFQALCDALPDKRHKAFLRYGYAQAIKFSGEYVPTEDGNFDLGFLARILRGMFENQTILRAIVDGDLKASGLDPDDLDALR